jgi:carbon-monoxide dehydrogenase large subunit
MEVRLIWDTGAFAEKGPTISQGGAKLCTGPYVFSSNARVESFTVFTNKPMAGAMRGYGLPQVAFARESQMDMIAQKLGMDPLALRMKNAVDEGSKAITGQRLYVVGMKECLEQLGKELYQSGEGALDAQSKVLPRGSWVRGKGMACVIKGVKTPTVSAAYVKVDEDGSTSILTSTVEVGQGSHTVLTQIVADVLGMEENKITVSFADTDVTPYDTSTTASRSTFHMGNAVLMAAEDVKRQLLALAVPLMNTGKDLLQLRDGSIWAPDGRSVSVAQVLKATFGAGAGAAVLGKGVYTPQDILGMEDVKEKKLEYFSTMSVFHQYAAQGAEVIVDLETGEVRVLRLVGVHDVGRAVNPRNCQQQVEGAMSMGLGYGLMEEYLWDKGRMINPDFLNYAVPTALDCPPMEVFLVERRHPQGPFGAKGLGEIAAAATAPAIANAVYNACGVRIRDLPLKAPKILKELQAQKK